MPNTTPTSQTKGIWKAAGAIFSGVVTALSLQLTTPLQKAYITGAAKRIVVPVVLSPVDGVIQASKTAIGFATPGNLAGKVVGVVACVQAAITGGTAVIKVLKGTSGGNTVVNTATKDATTLVANAMTTYPLSGVAADLVIPAGTGVYVECVTGAGVSAGRALTVFLVFELDDF